MTPPIPENAGEREEITKAIKRVLEDWFGEAIENMDEPARVRKFLLEPLLKAVLARAPAARAPNRDPAVVAAVQEALMKHPFWKPGLGSSGFAFGLANTAIDAYCTAVTRPDDK